MSEDARLAAEQARAGAEAANVAKSSFVLSTGGKEGQKLVFTYSRPDANHLVLQGLVMKQPVTIKLQKIDESKFLLPSRGFHWINEYPLNR